MSFLFYSVIFEAFVVRKIAKDSWFHCFSPGVVFWKILMFLE